MKGNANLYRVLFVVSVIIDVLFFFLALICMICGKGNLFEWIVMIVADIAVGIPTNISLHQRMRKSQSTEDVSNS